ncbi:MAG: winged helix-turn-helix transcriptional regulator [Archaeoglobus sp.]|nr:winged helix-turn-helix transcriptional regulator [Archaeoglobus sp.]
MIRSLRDIFTTSRSRILSQLKSRPYTISELAKITGYSKPTLAYHLEKLCETGMVKRVENGRKWVYYELTEKGRKLITRDAALLVGLLFAAISSFILSAYRLLTKAPIYGAEKAPRPLKVPTPFETPAPAIKETPSAIPTPAPTPTPMPTPMPTPALKAAPPDQLVIIFLIVGVVAILAFLLYKRR